MLDYYSFLSSLSNLVNGPLRILDARIGIPIFTALILGLIGSASPCQLTTNITALAFVSRETTNGRRVFGSALAYLLGKIIVYSLMGILVIIAGVQLSNLAVPVAVVVRKALGPLLLFLGLSMLGVIRLNLAIGQGISSWLEDRADSEGHRSSFLLGVAFAFAFCPTLFWLFFGLVIPMGLAAPDGILYPGVFALGTTVPLLFFASLMALGAQDIAKYTRKVRQFDHFVRIAVGIIFILGGINEIVLYWLT